MEIWRWHERLLTKLKFEDWNFVLFIYRKDHVIRELQSQKKWTEQWGYLLDEYQKVKKIFYIQSKGYLEGWSVILPKTNASTKSTSPVIFFLYAYQDGWCIARIRARTTYFFLASRKPAKHRQWSWRRTWSQSGARTGAKFGSESGEQFVKIGRIWRQPPGRKWKFDRLYGKKCNNKSGSKTTGECHREKRYFEIVKMASRRNAINKEFKLRKMWKTNPQTGRWSAFINVTHFQQSFF